MQAFLLNLAQRLADHIRPPIILPFAQECGDIILQFFQIKIEMRGFTQLWCGVINL